MMLSYVDATFSTKPAMSATGRKQTIEHRPLVTVLWRRLAHSIRLRCDRSIGVRVNRGRGESGCCPGRLTGGAVGDGSSTQAGSHDEEPTMTKLTDLQLILLTTASQRDDGSLLPPAASISDAGNRLQKACAGLLKRSLVAESAIGARAPSWREDSDARFGLMITDAGRAAIGVSPIAEADPAEGSEPAGGGAGAEVAPTQGAILARPGSKQAAIIDLLQRETGASISELTEATGWLPHTTRAALTGLRKRGLKINKEKVDGATRYHASAGAAE